MRHREEQFEPQFSKPEEESTAGEEIEQKMESQKDPEQEFLRDKINRVNGIFRVFSLIDTQRKKRSLDPLFELDYSDEYIKGLVPTRYPEDQKLTEKDLHQTENKVLALTLEVADQILQKRELSKITSRSMREDPKLLEQLCLILEKAELLPMNMQKQRPKEVQDLFKKILIERKGIPEENIKPEQIKQLTDSIGNAHDFIYIEEKILEKHSKE